MRDAGTDLQRDLGALVASSTGTCSCCGTPIGPGLSMAVVDADQAFEACDATLVMPAWRFFVTRFEAQFGSKGILVRRGRKAFMKVQDRVFSKGWWMITTTMMTTALLVYTSVSLAIVCGYVYKMQGIPIGGSSPQPHWPSFWASRSMRGCKPLPGCMRPLASSSCILSRNRWRGVAMPMMPYWPATFSVDHAWWPLHSARTVCACPWPRSPRGNQQCTPG